MPPTVSQHEPSVPERFFTREQANAMLPLIRAITEEIVDLSNDLIDRKQRLDLLGNKTVGRTADYAEELAQSEKRLGDDAYKLHALVEELCELGVQPKSLVKGQVVFPTQINDEVGYFSWKVGEQEVSTRHALEEDLLKSHSFDALLDPPQN